ncbi:MAG: proprotein convertase P-domain-containing protein [Bacteroidales bacterium]|nr:proprotein convertase P-domain-containing protein [Bacteroidales bacterium]
MYNIKQRRGLRYGLTIWLALWLVASVFGQSPVDTIPISGQRTIQGCSGYIVPKTDANGYCITNNNGSITINPPSGCGVHLEGSYIITNFYYGTEFKDHIYIYNGTSTTSPLLANMTDAGYVNVTSTGPMTIRFTTNSIFQYNGFQLEYSCVAGCACENNYPLTFSWDNDTLTVEWLPTQSGISTGYTLEYGPDGFTPGTGTIVTGITEPRYRIVGLPSKTKYDFSLTYPCSGPSQPVTDSYTIPEAALCIDMRELNRPNITCTYGGYGNNGNPYEHNGISSSHHSVVMHQSYDPYTGGLLRMIPDGETYSVKLGNAMPAESESISYTYTVDTAVADIILLKYAAVMENPGHPVSLQPRFDMEILDQNGQIVDPNCGQAQFISSQSLGWNEFHYRSAQSIYNGTQARYKPLHIVLWKDWTNIGFNISAYHGQQITIRLTNRDCGEGAHWAFAYFNLGCMKQKLTVEQCGDAATNTFTAPAGFNYNWYYTDNPGTIIGTGQSITVPVDPTKTLVCEVSDLEGQGCGFQLQGVLNPIVPESAFTIERDSCSRHYTFYNNSIISNGTSTPYATACETAYWNFGDGTTSQDYNTSHTYAQPGTYIVSLVSGMNRDACLDTLRQTLVVPVDTTEYWDTACVVYSWNDEVYLSSGDYVQHLTRLGRQCDSVVTLHLTIYPAFEHQDTLSLCGSDLPYTYGDTVFPIETRSGNYPIMFRSIHGCDSLIHLALTVNPPYTTRDTIAACPSLLANGIAYGDSLLTSAGDHPVRFTSVPGCDSTVVVTILPLSNTFDTVRVDTCDTYTWINGRTYTHSTTDTFILANTQGCDSIITLLLTIRHSTTGIDSITACGSYRWINDSVYTASTNTPTVTLTNAARCDSVVTLHLTIHPVYEHNDTVTLCGSDLPFTYGDTIFPIETRTSDHHILFHSQQDCDSTIHLHLVVNPPYSTRDTLSVCQSLLGNGVQYGDSLLTTAGTVPVHFLSGQQCDSTVWVTLLLPAETYDTVRVDTCDAYTWINGHTHTQSAIDTAILTNANGCDSIVTLLLNIRHSTSSVDSIVACGFYTWIDDSTYTMSTNMPTFTLTNSERCDSVVTLHLTIHPEYLNNDILHLCRNELPYRYSERLTIPANAISNRYTFRDSTRFGCDSITVVNVFIHENPHEHQYLTLPDSALPHYYQPLDTIFEVGTHSGNHISHYTADSYPYCDSVMELHLTIELWAETYTGINTQCDPDAQHPCNGWASVNVRGGLPPYRYLWDDPLHQTTDTAFNLCEGDYHVTITDSLGAVLVKMCHVSNYVSDTSVVYDTIGTSQIPYVYHGYIFQQPVNNTLLTIQNSQGCDSLVLYSLYIRPNDTLISACTLCNDFPVEYEGHTIYHAGLTTDSVLQANHSYLIRLFQVDTFHTPRSIVYDTACAPYIWNGHSYTESGIYRDTLLGANNCDSIVTLRLTIIDFPNPINNILLPDICVGDTGFITIGHNPNNNIYIATEEDASVSLSTSTFLPDGRDCGNGCSYQSAIHFNNFPASSIIRDVNDIRYVRLNLEHTFAGDLYIKISCPNGQNADILRFSRTTNNEYDSPCIQNIGIAHRGWQPATNGQTNASQNTYFGSPETTDNTNYPCNTNLNPPGTGWNYCWSNNINQGYQYGNTNSPDDDLIYRSANVQTSGWFFSTQRFRASDVTNGTHFYKPDQSFQALVGCPLNGDWTIEIIDGLTQDNGYLFSWELALNPELLNVPHRPIDSTTLTGLWSSRVNDSTYQVTPPATITHDTIVNYLISVFSDHGCHFDTIVSIHYKAPKTTELYDTICRNDLPYNWSIHHVMDTGSFILTSATMQAANGCDSTAILHLTVLDTTSSVVTEQIGAQQLPHAFNGCWFQYAVTDTVIIIENHLGCDSLIHYTLQIYNNTSEDHDTIVCREVLPMLWHGHLFTLTDTVAADTNLNANHSYHITRYHVRFHPVMSSALTHPLADICAGHTDSIRIGTSPQADIQLSYAGTNDSIPVITSITADGRWLSGNDSIYTITPASGLSRDTTVIYQFHAVNSLGCTLDNNFTVQMTTSITVFRTDTFCYGVLPYIHLNDTIRTPGTHTLTPELHPGIGGGCDTLLTTILTILDSINPIASVNIPDICAGDTALITISYDANAEIRIHQPNNTIYFPEPIFLPDDLNCPPYGNIYHSQLLITNAQPGATIRNVNDIRFVRLKIEHSAIEDLRINIQCPNGNSAKILPNRQTEGWPGQDPRGNNSPFQNIGRINMGVANRIQEVNNCNPSDNPIGIPWNYAWSNNTDQGYSYAGGTFGYLYEIPNIHFSPNPLWDNSYNQGTYSYKVDSSDVQAGTQFYHPKESFQQLVGCPVNGTWQIEVEDKEQNDNGYLTEWELSLAPDLFSTTVYSIVQKRLIGPWVQTLSDSVFQVTPPITLPNDTTIMYQLTTLNEFGCRYDTLIALHFKTPHYSNDTITACDSLRWNDSTYTTSGDYSIVQTGYNGCDSTAYLHLTLMQSLRDTIRDTICVGNPYVRHGFNLTATETANTGTFTYTRRHSNADACDSIITLLLKVNDYPTLVTCGDTVILLGGSAALWVTGADSCKWTPSETLSSAFTLQTTATPTQSTLYHVIGYNWNCSSHDSVQVLINRDLDTSICRGALPIVWNGITFTDTLPKSTILFNPNGLDDAITMHINYYPTQSTTVADTVVENLLPANCNGILFHHNTDTLFTLTDRHGCDSLVHYSLRVLWNSADTLTDQTCQNELPFIWQDTALYESCTIAKKLQAADGTDSVIVFILTVHNSYDTTITGHLCEGDEYHTNGFDIYAQETLRADTLQRMRQMQTIDGCDSIIRLKVSVTHAHPVITPLIGDYCYGAYEILSVDDIFSDYLWSTGETTPSITVTSPGEYTVTVIKDNCSGNAHFRISPCVFTIYLPNAITPSLLDGNNDYFCLDERAQNLIDGEQFNIRIFNRWGDLVFYSNDKAFKWDGSFNGKIFYNNVYVYKITCFDKNGDRHVLKGTITVL